ncbi:MAG TPA: hypothetical protein VF987_09195 [Rhodospirillales bacterium]
MTGVGRIQALCLAVVAAAYFSAAPARAEEASSDADMFAAWDTVPEQELRDQSGGEEVVIEGDLGLNVGINNGSVNNSSADNTITGQISSNTVMDNRGINLVDFNSGNNVVILKNVGINVFMK